LQTITRFGLTERLRQFNVALTPAQLAKLLNCSKQTILRASAKGEIPCFKIGSRFRYVPEYLIAWLDTRNEQICS